jgi:hypothetical protein
LLRVLALAAAAGLVTLAVLVFLGLPPRGDVRALAAKTPERTALMLQRETEAGEAQAADRRTTALVG